MLKLKLQYFGHLMQRTDSLGKTLMLGKTEGKRRRGHQRMRWLDSFKDSIDMSLSKLQEMVKDRETWHAAVHRVTKTYWQNNNMNTGVHVSFQIIVCSRYTPRSGIARSHDNSAFSFLRTLHIVPHGCWTNLHSHQQCKRVAFSPCPLQYLLFIDSLVTIAVTCLRWCLIVVLICIFLIISNAEQEPFHVPVGQIYAFFGEISRSSAHFLIGLFSCFVFVLLCFVLVLSYMSCLYILEIDQVYWK